MAGKKDLIRTLDFKDARGYTYASADLDVLLPDPENPRLPVQASSLDTLLSLLRLDPDGLYNLARDLVKQHGGNPAELLNVTRVDDMLVVKEGNRRVAARKILHNPEQLRGHVTDREFDRWRKLGRSDEARKLPRALLVVIGENHDEWVARRHLGPQNGVGVSGWDPKAKARHDARRRGVKDRALSLLESLKKTYPVRFTPLEPPNRTFTTLTRVLDSPAARSHLGIDVDEHGNVILNHGERSLRLIEEILRDLQRTDDEKLTSRSIPNKDALKAYLATVETRIAHDVDEEPISLSAAPTAAKPVSSATAGSTPGTTSSKPPDVLKSLTTPATPRLRLIFDELKKVKRDGAPNSAMVLTRVLLELSIDNYATANSLPFAHDKDGELEKELADFRKQLGIAKITPTKKVSEALKGAALRTPRLPDKLENVVRHLITTGKMSSKDGNAKIRELRANDVVPLLNDAVHRLEHFPSIERVNHILNIVRPIFNAITSA